MALLALSVASLASNSPSDACPAPHRKAFEGCVIDGLFITTQGANFAAMPEDLADELEGKRVSVVGWTVRGAFSPQLSTLQVGDACDLRAQGPALRDGLVRAHDFYAFRRLNDEHLDLAEDHIERAIELDHSSFESYLLRARIFLAMDHRRRAHASARHALSLAQEDHEVILCEAFLTQLEPNRVSTQEPRDAR